MLFNNLSKFVSHLKNGYLRRKLFVVVPSSVFLLRVLKLMYLAGYISGFQKTKYLVIVYLKYYNGVPVFSNICSFYNKNNKFSIFLFYFYSDTFFTFLTIIIGFIILYIVIKTITLK